jgi:hypothetical protein
MSQFQLVDAAELEGVEGGVQAAKAALFAGIVFFGAIGGIGFLVGAAAGAAYAS